MRIDLFRANSQSWLESKWTGGRWLEPTSRKYENTEGIYVLIKDRQVVYVGVSSNLYSRIQTHVRDKNKDFDVVCVIVDEHNLMSPVMIETVLINLFLPKYNKKIPRAVPKVLETWHLKPKKNEEKIQEVFDSKESKMTKFLKRHKEVFKQLSEL